MERRRVDLDGGGDEGASPVVDGESHEVVDGASKVLLCHKSDGRREDQRDIQRDIILSIVAMGMLVMGKLTLFLGTTRHSAPLLSAGSRRTGRQ